MNNIGLSKDQCIKILGAYISEIKAILKYFDDDGNLISCNKDKAQELLKNLKECFNKDYDLRKTEKGHKEMTKEEHNFYFHAIHEASNKIHIKSNSTPNQKWVEELESAEGIIEHYLYGLERFDS